MVHQRKKRPQEQNSSQPMSQVESNLFASSDYTATTEEEMVQESDLSSSLTLEDQQQLAMRSNVDFGQIPLHAANQVAQRRPQIPLIQPQTAQVSASGPQPSTTESQPIDAGKDNKIQRQMGESIGVEGGAVSPQLVSQIQTAKGRGQSLDDGLQRSMGQAMGADFSHVKVHTDDRAHQLSQSLQAKAFTTGQDVFFKRGEYQPGHPKGQELIAHELTHTVQQGGLNSPLQRTANPIIQREIDIEQSFKDYQAFEKKMTTLAQSQNSTATVNSQELFQTLGSGGNDNLYQSLSTNLAFMDENLDLENAKTYAKVDVISGLSKVNEIFGDVAADQLISETFKKLVASMNNKNTYYRDPGGIKLTVVTPDTESDFNNAFAQAKTGIDNFLNTKISEKLEQDNKQEPRPNKRVETKLLRTVDLQTDEKSPDAYPDETSLGEDEKLARRAEFIQKLENQFKKKDQGSKYTVKNKDKNYKLPQRAKETSENNLLMEDYERKFKIAWNSSVPDGDADAAWKEAQKFVNRDKLTRLYTGEQREYAINNIYANSDNAKYRVYVVIDIANLGGLDEKLGRKEASKVFKGMSDIVDDTLRQTAGLKTIEGYRHGGDEVSYYMTFDENIYSDEAQVKTQLDAEVGKCLESARNAVYNHVKNKIQITFTHHDDNKENEHAFGFKGLGHRKKNKGRHFVGTGLYYGYCNTDEGQYMATAGQMLEASKSKEKSQEANKAANAAAAESDSTERTQATDYHKSVHGSEPWQK